jgi:putative ABC transport system permease protein
METLWQDLRYSLRVMAKSPGFVAVAVIALALGIGANTAIFSVVDAVLFRALPYKDPGQLVWVTNFNAQQGQNLVFGDMYAGWRKQNHVFTDVAAYNSSAEFSLTGAGQPLHVRGGRVTASFLPTLGISPEIGRNFTADEDRPGGPQAVLLSNALWRSQFSSNPAILGHVIALEGNPYTVVGVLRRDFEFLDNATADLLVPFQLAENSVQNDNGRITVRIQVLSVVARLRQGVTLPAVTSEIDAISERVLATLPAGIRGLAGRQAQAFTLHDHQVGSVQRALLVLLGSVGFVLLIACANVANLQLARSVAREKEVAIRRALGASRWRLARLLLTESSAVALTGGVTGLLLATWVIRLIRRFGPANIPHLAGARMDVRVLLFTLGVALLTGLLFGMAPMLAAFRVSLNDTLKEGGAAGAGSATRRPQKVLMVAEIALSLVLFIGAGLLVRSFMQLTSIQAGFDPSGVLTARVTLPLNEYQRPDQQQAFFQQLADKLQALPGVTAAGVTGTIPLRASSRISTVQIEGQPQTDFNQATTAIPTAAVNVVSTGYFNAMRIPLIAGRYVDDRDGTNAPLSIVVNQAFVRRYLPKENPIGKKVNAGIAPGPHGSGQDWTIVGVIGDVKQKGLANEVRPEVTATVRQAPAFNMYLVLRATVDPASLASAVRKQVADLNSNLPVYGVQTMDELLSAEVATQRFNAAALASFAGLAVLLAAVGIYGVMAYAVGQRIHEIGIRMALGASPADVQRMILGQGLKLALLGVVLGLAASFALTRLMRTLLFETKATDPVTFSVVTVVLVIVALAACWIPAHRATRVDPVIALRYE